MSFLRNKWTVIFFACMLVAFVVIIFRPLGDNFDVWTQLAQGRIFLDTLSFDKTIFSWTPVDNSWRDVSWLGSIILFCAYSLAGFIGLVCFQWVAIGIITGLYLYYLKAAEEKIDIVNLASILLAFAVLNINMSIIRLEIFTITYFSGIVFIYLYSKKNVRNLFFIYPIIFLAWANSHNGFIIGLLFVFLTTTLEILDFSLIRSNPLPRYLLKQQVVSVVLSFAAVALNPDGIQYIFSLAKSDYFPSAVHVNMWSFLLKEDFNIKFIYASLANILMLIFFSGTCGYAFKTRRFIDLTIVLLNASVFLFSMSNARSAAFFPILWLFSTAFVLQSTDYTFFKKKTAVIALVILLAFGSSLTFHSLTYLEGNYWFGINENEWVPENEIQYLKEKKLPGPLFNDYSIGAYLIGSAYPDYKVFIDSRHFPYVKSGVLDDWNTFALKPDQDKLAEINKKYPFKTAIIHLRRSDMISVFADSAHWKLTYFGSVAAIFVRTDLIDQKNLATFKTDLSPERFERETNPLILQRVFSIYYKHRSHHEAATILGYYRNNVNRLYAMRDLNIDLMDLALRQYSLQPTINRQSGDK